MKSIQQRQQERREAKLAEIREQVAQGTLRIRKMTAKERAKNPPTPRSAPRRPPKRWL